MTTLGPYELNTIVTGECSQMMAALPDNCIDLTVTSPPYDSLREYRGYTFDFEPIACQLWRVTKPGGVVVWVVTDETIDGSETLTSLKQALYFRELGFNVETMIYTVSGTGAKGDNRFYWQAFEYMYVFSKGIPKTINLIKDRKQIQGGQKSHQSRLKVNGKDRTITYGVTPEMGRRFNVWHYQPGVVIDGHPAQFPEALARDHILSWSMPGDTVLDPMMGSGTVGKMCALLGRNYLGFEISPEYVELARRRVANVEAQPFLMPPSVDANGKPVQARLGLDAT